MPFKDYSPTPGNNVTIGEGIYVGPNMDRNNVRPALQQLAADGKDLDAAVRGLIANGVNVDPLLRADLALSGQSKGAALIGTELSGTLAQALAAQPIRFSGLTPDAGIDNIGTITGTDNTAALTAAMNATHGVYRGGNLPAGKFRVNSTFNFPADVSSEYRQTPYSLLGAWTGEPYIADNTQEGTTIAGSDATSPTLRIQQRAAQQGSGSVEFGKMRVVGKQNANIATLDIDGLSALNHLHDFVVFNYGAGDGIHAGWLITTPVERAYVFNSDWSSTTKPYADRTGIGFRYTGDKDHALAKLNMTVRGFKTAMQIGDTSGVNKIISALVERCEASATGDGIILTDLAENTTLLNYYAENVMRNTVADTGRFTLHLNTHSLLSGTAELKLQGRYPTVVGGQYGVKADGATAITVGASVGVYGAGIYGATIIKGQSGSSVGLHIEPQADPRVTALVNYDANWGGGSGPKMLDESYSSGHGGVAGAHGSGVVGILTRQGGLGRDIPCLSRGSINLYVDPATLTAGSVNVSGTLSLSAASVHVLSLTGTTAPIIRFVAPNLPDKTGTIYIDNGYAIFDPATYLGGLARRIQLPAGRKAWLEYQVNRGSLAKVHIKNFRLEDPNFTVAELATLKGDFDQQIIATNGRKSGEGPGAGTGCPVWWDGTNWRTFYDNSVVAA